MSMPSRSWTPEEDAAILAAYSDPAPDAVMQLALRLGRSYNATRTHAGHIGARRRDVHGNKIKTGYQKAPGAPSQEADAIQLAYNAWRPVVCKA